MKPIKPALKVIIIAIAHLWVILLIAWGVLFPGCAWHTAKYTGIDNQGKPYTIELSARRFAMGQDVQGFSAQFPGGYKVGFDSSKGDPTKVMENFFGVLGPVLQAYIGSQTKVTIPPQ